VAAKTAEIRDAVRERYAAAATRASQGAYEDARRAEASCCGGQSGCSGRTSADQQNGAFGAELYDDGDEREAPEAAIAASLGCGVPTAVADLHEGETVLDLGSGAGADVLISARRVGPTGKAYGLDMTDEMLALARENQREAGVQNVEWLRGEIEDIPLPDGAVDVLISNCVINLSADKHRVLQEAARVLRPGGRLAVTDVVADADMDEAIRADMEQWTGCIAGALTREEYIGYLADAGLEQVEVHETHRVHERAASAVIRARKPAAHR
jgi:ubiquinone/menaquinone biosynthesis C-methylase UbiE